MSAPLWKFPFPACVLVAVSMAWTDPVMAVLTADSFAAVRMLESPSGRLAMSGGISNAGDVFGMELPEWRPDPADHEHFEAPVRWLRSADYQGEVVSGGLTHVEWGGKGIPVEGESFWGIHAGGIRDMTPHVQVGHSGFAHGSSNVNNWYGFRYDIKNDIMTDLGAGMINGGNTRGMVTGVWSDCCGSHGNGYYSKLLDVNQEGLSPKYEVKKWFPNFFNDVFPWDINDNNVIVGNVGSLFDAMSSVAAKILPAGDGEWGEPEKMEILVAEGGGRPATSNAISISEGDRPFAAGVASLDDLHHAVVWDVNSGTLVADFGQRTKSYYISANGKYVIGSSINFLVFPPTLDPVVWMTDDEWQTWSVLDLNEDILGAENPPPGAETWESFDIINGINDDGMIVGQGTPLIGFEGAEQAPRTAASAPELVDTQRTFLLDTQELGRVLLGDVNNDGAIDNLDITPFIAALASEDEAAFLVDFPQGSYSAADVDTSGSPDNLDITPFINLLTSQGSDSAVPEPASLALLAAGALMAVRRGHRANI